MRHFLLLLTRALLPVVIIFPASFAQPKPSQQPIVIRLEPDEKWWGGLVSEGHLAPFGDSLYRINLYGDNKSNQAQPLLISSRGRYVWSGQPFAFSITGKELIISQAFDSVHQEKPGTTLAEAYRRVSQKFFPPSGKLPDPLLFTQPQWNTWIELTYNQNQQDVLQYARNILANGFSPGVLMIDDTWQEDYGVWRFHADRFPDPKKMMDELHGMGFKVMLWICPFVSPDSPPYRELRARQAFLREAPPAGGLQPQRDKAEPAVIRWWNGASAVLDFTNPSGREWFNAQLKYLQAAYGVDGFKFDAGDTPFYPSNALSYENVLPNQHTELFGQFGLQYPLNEYRAMWKMAGQPLAQRLQDKNHTWTDLQKLIPQVLSQGLMGYAFTCPDMIGGGDYQSFLHRNDFDQDLVVRSAQCHALMPMMQFSVAPWRILDKPHRAAIQKAVALRQRLAATILQLAQASAKSGEPVVRHLEYVFPHQGLEKIKDQFMLGDRIMVAPVVEKGQLSRLVQFPKGKWKAEDGRTFRGPQKVLIKASLDQLPFFEKID